MTSSSKTLIEEDNENNPTVHVRIFQRTTRKFITTIEGLNQDTDFKLFLKQMKNNFHCNGSVKCKADTEEKLIQLSGDRRNDVVSYLTNNNVCAKECIKLHGC